MGLLRVWGWLRLALARSLSGGRLGDCVGGTPSNAGAATTASSGTEGWEQPGKGENSRTLRLFGSVKPCRFFFVFVFGARGLF
jgi:hypothetical protein